jgi:hypothetical protein
MSIVPKEVAAQIFRDCEGMTDAIERAAEWALDLAIMICNENGHLDGHSCAEAIHDLLSGNDVETITGLHALSSLIKGGESDEN